MNLSVKERLLLLNVLPAQETYANMLIVKELMAELSFSEADHKLFSIVEDGDGVKWDGEKETEKEVAIGPVAYGLIQGAFKKLDSERAISVDLIPLYKRFVVDEGQVEILTLAAN